MKLIVQIPCFNEEKTLADTIKDIPFKIDGIDTIEILVIDDGSTDQTLKTAKQSGTHHIISFSKNQGLAKAFMAGLDASLKLGADIIVNTDADNQYNGNDIPKLVRPIMEGESDMVVGNRDTDKIARFSFLKKRLQKLGTLVVRKISGTDIQDASSGFRAFSREAALKLNVVSRFSYTLETLIQAGRKNIVVSSVTIKTNETPRKSRLFSSIGQYIKESAITILRVYTTYRPLKVFLSMGGIIFTGGLVIALRFLYLFIFFKSSAQGHIQSLILSAALMIIGFIVAMFGIVADLISVNRELIENMLYRLKKIETKDEDKK